MHFKALVRSGCWAALSWALLGSLPGSASLSWGAGEGTPTRTAPLVTAGREAETTVSLGDKPAAWSQLPEISGNRISLADFRDFQLLVVVFMCPDCPAAQANEERLIKLVQDFQGKSVGWVAINVNDGGTLEAMKRRATEKGYNFPYALDASQQTAKTYGAHCTPHCFVLNAERALVYRGAIDNSLRPDGVTQQFLRQALESLLAGQVPNVAETEPPGCGILWK